MPWFDNKNMGSAFPLLDYGANKLANYASNALSNNQNNYKENFDYNALYGDNYSDLKIPRGKKEGILTSMFGLNISDLEKKAMAFDAGAIEADGTKAMPGATLNDWGPLMGPIPVAGDDIQEQVTETETIDPYENDPYGTEHHYVTPDKKRSFSLPTFGLSAILKGLKNQFEYKGAEKTAFDPNTGQYLTAEEQDKLNARGGWYSDAARYDRRQRKRVANMLHRRDVLKKDINDKRLEEMIKKGYGEDKTITPSPGPGTKGVYEEHGWTQPTYHDDSFTSPRDSESAFGGDFSGAGPSRHARGGRVRYSTGGRVGILSVF